MRRGNNFTLLVQEFFQELHIFVIDVTDAIFFKTAEFLWDAFLL